jgi:hypothetical protein
MTEYEHLTDRQRRAFIVAEYGPEGVSALDWLQHTSTRDPTTLEG